MAGRTLGPYRIIEALGAHATGDVYRAHDARLNQEVVLRLLPATDAEDDDVRARVLRDARAAAGLHHPHICAVVEVGEADGQAFIATEVVDGGPLSEILATDGLVDADVLDYGVQICDAVAHAHAKGVLHRRLNTGSIMITAAGRVKVLDFAFALTRDTRAFAYLSPEQLRGAPATEASDVWALGVVLYEMASGTRPFNGNSDAELATAILERRPPALPTSVHALLRGIVSRCLAKDPLHRYQDAAELRDALEAVRAGAAGEHAPSFAARHAVAPDGPEITPTRRATDRPLIVIAAIPLFAAALLASVMWRGC